MDAIDADSLDFTGWPRPVVPTDDGSVRFADGITLDDLSVAASDDGHHLMIYCRDTLVSVLSAIGGGDECFRFGDGGFFTAEELLARL